MLENELSLFFNNTTGTDINNRKLANMGIFLNTAKADRFSYLHETGKNRPVQLYRPDRLQLCDNIPLFDLNHH
jgi:hypothetical protein